MLPAELVVDLPTDACYSLVGTWLPGEAGVLAEQALFEVGTWTAVSPVHITMAWQSPEGLPGRKASAWRTVADCGAVR